MLTKTTVIAFTKLLPKTAKARNKKTPNASGLPLLPHQLCVNYTHLQSLYLLIKTVQTSEATSAFIMDYPCSLKKSVCFNHSNGTHRQAIQSEEPYHLNVR